jgi:hypothetical protein
MTTIQISPQLADKLNRLAEREHKTVDEVLERLLEPENVNEDDEAPGGKVLLEGILKAKIRSGKTDTAERSREILDNEFADHLWNRMHEETNNDTKE